MPYFVTEDNCNLYYDLRGKGKAVVMIHGGGCNRNHFKKQLVYLRERYQVLSYDLRGHGDSDRTEYGLTLPQCAKDLKELVEFCELKDVVLVGWSMGTSIIFEYIRQFGCQNISKLCLIDMTPKFVTDREWRLGLNGSYEVDSLLNDVSAMAADWDRMVDGVVPALFSKVGYEGEKENFDFAYSASKNNTPHVMINMWVAMGVKDYRKELKNITVPTLITYGGKSKLYPPEVSKYMNEQIQDSILMEFEECGHSLHMEEPERFNNALDNFIG